MAAKKKPAASVAPSPLAVEEPGNPLSLARATRKLEVEAVLKMFREELPALRTANPHTDVRDLIGSLHRRYEQEYDAIGTAEEAIDAAR